MTNNKEYDIIVVGGGPAGLTAAQYATRAGRKTAIIEEMSCGGQLIKIDEIENYPGYEKISGYDISTKLEQQTVSCGAEIIYDTVNTINKSENLFYLNTSNDTFTAKSVIIATGAKHKELEVTGEQKLKGHGVSYCASCDGSFFRNKKILVCGGGDSAVQETLYLAKLTDKLTICHRRNTFRAQQSLVDKLKSLNNIRYKMNHTVTSINEDNNKVGSVTFLDTTTNNQYTEQFDAVFVFIGSIPQTDIVPQCEKDQSGYIITDSTMHTSQQGMFAAGDVRSTPFRQIVTAASDGAIAAHYASEYIDSL